MTGALDAIAAIEVFIVSIARDTPYLGPLKPGETVNSRGYVVRRGNRTIYPMVDRSVLIKVTGESGAVGWGETYGLVAPEAVKAIVEDVLAPVMLGRDPGAPVVLHEDLYDLMRVRGYFGGFYVDALAGVDIAVWDLFGRLTNRPLSSLLGGARRSTIPAYASGLPRATLNERCDLARDLASQGVRALKFAAVISEEETLAEMRALRAAVGPDIRIAVDLHWRHTAPEAIGLIRKLEAHDLWFAEAPCEPEDIEGQAAVARAISAPLALGEEWRTIYEHVPRFERRSMGILQPEMGRTGVTEFLHIGRMATAFHIDVIPHATIGLGIFLAASLHAASALRRVPFHEYQHSVFDRNLRFIDGDMACEGGAYRVPSGPGHGVTPSAEALRHVVG